MPFSIRPYRRFPVQCSVTYNAGPFQGQGTISNLSCTGWRLTGDVPMRRGEILSLTVTLPTEQRIEVTEAVVRWGGMPNNISFILPGRAANGGPKLKFTGIVLGRINLPRKGGWAEHLGTLRYSQVPRATGPDRFEVNTPP